MKTGSIVLAAGASRRMGGHPKALLEFEGETFISRLCRMLPDPVFVVMRPDAGWKAPANAIEVVNPDPDAGGMISSLRLGIEAALREDCRRVLFMPVDLPAVTQATIRRVRERGGDVVAPRCGDRHGHPVAIGEDVMIEMFNPEAATPREVIWRDPSRVNVVEVFDRGIYRDVDEPRDYEELLSSK